MKEVFVNYCKMINFITDAGFFKRFSFGSFFCRFAHMNCAADGIKIVFFFVSGKKNTTILDDDSGSLVPEPCILIRKTTVTFHISYPNRSRILTTHIIP